MILFKINNLRVSMAKEIDIYFPRLFKINYSITDCRRCIGLSNLKKMLPLGEYSKLDFLRWIALLSDSKVIMGSVLDKLKVEKYISVSIDNILIDSQILTKI